MINIIYYYCPENESKINLEIWKSLIDAQREHPEIYKMYHGTEYSIELNEVSDIEQFDLPDSVKDLLAKKGSTVLPILMVNSKIKYYGSFSIKKAIEKILDFAIDLQIEDDRE
ncbi:TPA: hypothetical protein ACSYVK_00645 [Listeria monocytogenes]|nr:arsenic metallochaperone ArsD family protein [Listeria monocytogenes]